MVDVVHVACKLPHGLVFGDDVHRDGAMGLRDRVRIAGVAWDRGAPSAIAPELFGEYALTLNVPRASWERWCEANKDTRLVALNFVFADANLGALKRRALAGGAPPTGLEQSKGEGKVQ